MTNWRITYASPQVSVPVTQSVGTTHAPAVHHAPRLHRWRVLWPCVLALSLGACTSTSERSLSSTARTQIVERHPTTDGGFIEKTTEYIDGEKTRDITTKADVDWAGAVSKGVGQAATGDWLGLAVTAGSMLVAGGGAALTAAERKRRMRAESDADEHYNDYKRLKEDTSA